MNHPEFSYKHEVDNEDCLGCWETPQKHHCGGLAHNEFGDEDYEGYWLVFECDKCGEMGSGEDLT